MKATGRRVRRPKVFNDYEMDTDSDSADDISAVASSDSDDDFFSSSSSSESDEAEPTSPPPPPNKKQQAARPRAAPRGRASRAGKAATAAQPAARAFAPLFSAGNVLFVFLDTEWCNPSRCYGGFVSLGASCAWGKHGGDLNENFGLARGDFYSLIKPPASCEFLENCTNIHGITRAQVAAAPDLNTCVLNLYAHVERLAAIVTAKAVLFVAHNGTRICLYLRTPAKPLHPLLGGPSDFDLLWHLTGANDTAFPPKQLAGIPVGFFWCVFFFFFSSIFI